MREIINLPLSSNQYQFWIIDRMNPGTPAYNIPSVLRLSGTVNRDMLERAINEIVKRHEIFRTVFPLKDNNPVQRIEKELFVSLDVVDLMDLSVESRHEKLDEYVNAEINTSFDLENGPLIRTKLFKTSALENVLTITKHHIIIDLHSNDLFSSELSSLYNSFVLNQPIEINIPNYQYSNYSKRQTGWLKSEEYWNMLSFWKESLHERNLFLDFPLDKQYPLVQSLNGNELYFELSNALTEKLKEFCRIQSSDIFVVLLSAYYTLLYKYSRQAGIVIGVPFTNRRHQEDKNTMGCFMNILPVPVDLADDMSFIDCMKQVRKIMLQAHRNQEAPFASIVDFIKPEKNTRYNPIFQYGFTFEHPMRIDLLNVDSIPVKTYIRGSQLNLFCVMWNNGDAFNGKFKYKTDVFTEDSIRRLSANYITILNSIVEDPGSSIAELESISEMEYNLIIEEWNKTAREYSRDKNVYDLFAEQAAMHPLSVAVICKEKQLTYSELDNMTNILSIYLKKNGIGSGSFVGIFIERSVEMLAALLAVVKSGAAYVPMDPVYPSERLSYMIETIGLSYVLTQSSIEEKLPGAVNKILVDNWKIIAEESDGYYNKGKVTSNLQYTVKPEDTSYVIFTSGSTGRPKGVEVTHGALTNFLCSMAVCPGFNKNDYLLALTTICFDIAALELFLPVTRGGKVEILTESVAKDSFLLKEKIENSGATVVQATPTTWNFLIDAGLKIKKPLKILCGGEALNGDLADRLLVGKNCELWNMYGPTETTIWSSVSRITSGMEINIGRPIANTEFYILNNNRPVPIGVTGELFIGGDGIARGYFNQPELTDEIFFRNPFKNDTNSRIYKTGDLAKYLPNGNVLCLGRADRQIKLRGFRIESDEIESALNDTGLISNSAVILKENTHGEKIIAAYIILDHIKYEIANDNNDYNKIYDELREILRKKLPDYMIPSYFIILENLPLTLNGKIDRKVLSLLELSYKLNPNNRIITAPQNEMEKQIYKIWKKILNTDDIGVDDNFFDIGGNSLCAIQLQIELLEHLNRKLQIVKIFEYPTIHQFARYLNSEANDEKIIKKAEERTNKKIDAMKRRKNIVRKF